MCVQKTNFSPSENKLGKPIFSIIVPIYNVAEFLDECIESLVSQTFAEIEILLVDDGSPDNSGEICDNWALKDERIKVIHKENGGLSSAYNSGLEAAAGDYILFVDGDDFIEPNTCEFLYQTLQERQVEVVIFGSKTIYAPDNIEIYDKCDEIVSTREALFRIFAGGTLPAMTNMRVHSAAVAKKVKFPVGRNYEDAATHMEFLSQVDQVCINLEPLYCYRRRPGSITLQAYNKAHSWDVVFAWQHTRELVLAAYPDDRELLKAIDSRVYKAYFAVLDAMALPEAEQDFPARDKAVQYLRKNWLAVMRNPHVRWTRKIGMLALKISVPLYAKIVRSQL